VNGIHEVGGSSPLGSTTKNTKGPAKAGPFTLPPHRGKSAADRQKTPS